CLVNCTVQVEIANTCTLSPNSGDGWLAPSSRGVGELESPLRETGRVITLLGKAEVDVGFVTLSEDRSNVDRPSFRAPQCVLEKGRQGVENKCLSCVMSGHCTDIEKPTL
uniref:Uncharacterized protein n=1 Tax=Sander lucioperca TaxID=283035 RepID=A0A8C9XZW5_SANLU